MYRTQRNRWCRRRTHGALENARCYMYRTYSHGATGKHGSTCIGRKRTDSATGEHRVPKESTVSHVQRTGDHTRFQQEIRFHMHRTQEEHIVPHAQDTREQTVPLVNTRCLRRTLGSPVAPCVLLWHGVFCVLFIHKPIMYEQLICNFKCVLVMLNY